MRSVLICILAVGAASSKEWEDFKNKFERSYESDKEEMYRKGIFEKNVELIKDHNRQELGYTLGVNQFADLLTDEWSSKYFGMAKPAAPFGDSPYLGRHEVGNATLASSVDWTEKGAVTPVKNQGQCGSCWAFSSTGSLEGAYELATGKLVSLSEQQLVDCASKEGEQGCNGGLMDGAFKYAKKTAMCTEESYAYKAKTGTKCQASSCTTGVPAGTVTGYKDVSTDSEKDLMSAVAQQPVSIAIEADKSVFQLYKSGVLTSMCGTSLDHGVLVVGYGTLSGKDYWKVKNSWGSSWGEDGYILLQRGKGSSGECGILTQPSYPIMKSQTEVVV